MATSRTPSSTQFASFLTKTWFLLAAAMTKSASSASTLALGRRRKISITWMAIASVSMSHRMGSWRASATQMALFIPRTSTIETSNVQWPENPILFIPPNKINH